MGQTDYLSQMCCNSNKKGDQADTLRFVFARKASDFMNAEGSHWRKYSGTFGFFFFSSVCGLGDVLLNYMDLISVHP